MLQNYLRKNEITTVNARTTLKTFKALFFNI